MSRAAGGCVCDATKARMHAKSEEEKRERRGQVGKVKLSRTTKSDRRKNRTTKDTEYNYLLMKIGTRVATQSGLKKQIIGHSDDSSPFNLQIVVSLPKQCEEHAKILLDHLRINTRCEK